MQVTGRPGGCGPPGALVAFGVACVVWGCTDARPSGPTDDAEVVDAIDGTPSGPEDATSPTDAANPSNVDASGTDGGDEPELRDADDAGDQRDADDDPDARDADDADSGGDVGDDLDARDTDGARDNGDGSVADAEGGTVCGARVADYAYERPFADTAAWNVPVCDLADWEHSDEYVERFWFYSNDRDADPTLDDPRRGDHRINFGFVPETDFALPVYDAADATTTRQVRLRAGWGGSTNLEWADTVPWNPAWRAMRGSDASLVILDERTGSEWDLWGVVQTDALGIYNDSQCWLAAGGYDRTRDLCVGSAHLVRHPSGELADYRTYGGNFPSRGVRIQHYAMLTRPEEVAAGEIRHALMMGASNTMFGPLCSPEELDTPAAGSTCGFSLAPAGGLEWLTPWTASPHSEQEQRERSIPEGIRFALTMTDAEIDAWLDSREYTGRKRETARIFAVALRDYGWMITDTGGTASWSVSGAANPDTAARWRELGIDDDGFDLLFGLLARDRIRVVRPAINECADGTVSEYGCSAGSTHY